MFPRRFHALIFTLSYLFTYPISAIELTLNQQQIAVLHSEMLISQTIPDSTSNGLPAIKLETLFPWLTEIAYMVIASDTDLQRWESDRLKKEDWSSIKLVWNLDRWEVNVEQDVFTSPDRISVHGTILDVPSLRIWSSIHDEEYIGDLKSALAFRHLEIEWHEFQRLPYLLHNIPQNSLPHLVFLDDVDLIDLLPDLASYSRIIDASSQWLTTASDSFTEGEYPYPLSLNLRDGITSLQWLLAENPDLFDPGHPIPDVISDILKITITYADSVIDTTTPMKSLDSGEAVAAVITPWSGNTASKDNRSYTSLPAPGNSIKVLRSHYVAIPRGLLPHDAQISSLALNDALRFSRLVINSQSAPIPIKPRLSRYLKAYSRIGRLVLSGEMKAAEGIRILNAYTDGR